MVAFVLAEEALRPLLPLRAQEPVGEPLREEGEQDAGVGGREEAPPLEELDYLLQVGMGRRCVALGDRQVAAGVPAVDQALAQVT